MISNLQWKKGTLNMTKVDSKTAVLCIVVGTITFLAGWFSVHLVNEQRGNHPDASAILESMSDFTFVGEGAFLNDLSIPAHGVERQPLPRKLEAGHVYIFHYSRVDNNELVHALTDRLKARGVKTFNVVGHGSGSYVGGSSFTLSFQEGGYTGFISTALDNQIVTDAKLSESLSPDDYILVLQKVVE